MPSLEPDHAKSGRSTAGCAQGIPCENLGRGVQLDDYTDQQSHEASVISASGREVSFRPAGGKIA